MMATRLVKQSGCLVSDDKQYGGKELIKWKKISAIIWTRMEDVQIKQQE